MTLPSLASPDDLSTWMGVPVTDEDRAEAILSAASTLVRLTKGRAYVDDDGTPDEDLSATQLDAAKTVVLLVAERVWNNPRGVTQESAGPYSRSVAAWAALGLRLEDGELALLGNDSDGIPGLSSVRVVAPVLASASRWQNSWDVADEDEDL